MKEKQAGKKPPSEKQQVEFRRLPILWIMVAFVLTYYLIQSFQRNPPVALSYSEFKQQVRQENVTEIVVDGMEIKGSFKDEYTRVSAEDTLAFQQFTTVRPSFEDNELMQLLEAHDVQIAARESSSGGWLQLMLISFLPWILILGYFMYVRHKMQGQMQGMMGNGLFGIGKSKAKRYKETSTAATFADVAGLENAKQDLREIIDYLKIPEKFVTLGADIPRGVLLVGPPGTGKTLLARATAGEAGVTFYNISGSEFIEMFVGVGASRVRDMFENAKNEAPAIIFIDEIDSVGRARGAGLGGGHDEREQTLNQILSEMDGFAPHESVVVMAATNRPDVLDPALTRPGRFDRLLTLDLPHKEARQKILAIHMKKTPVADEVDVLALAARTVGFSGADIKNLVNEAALLAGRRNKKVVEAEDFDEARDKILLGQVREDLINDREKKVVAYHEAGHALLANILPGADPVKKVTIIPRGRSLGATEQMPDEDRHNLESRYLLNRIAIMLGGRVSERLVFGDLTNGAADDLKQVTRIARLMVCQWGMSDKVGPVSFKQGEEHMFLGREIAQPKDHSEETGRIIDEEIQRIISGMEKKAYEILEENREKLDALAHALIEHESLDSEQIKAILDETAADNAEKNGKHAKLLSLEHES